MREEADASKCTFCNNNKKLLPPSARAPPLSTFLRSFSSKTRGQLSKKNTNFPISLCGREKRGGGVEEFNFNWIQTRHTQRHHQLYNGAVRGPRRRRRKFMASPRGAKSRWSGGRKLWKSLAECPVMGENTTDRPFFPSKNNLFLSKEAERVEHPP